MMSGKDVIGLAQTGTGKTLAYLLPMLSLWKFSKEPHPQILIIVPTRELVVQVVREVEKLVHGVLSAGIVLLGLLHTDNVLLVDLEASLVFSVPRLVVAAVTDAKFLKGTLKTSHASRRA